MKLGIDIGSSYATVASLDNDGKPVLLKDVSSKKDYEIFTPLKVQVEGQFAFVGQTVNALLNSKFKLNIGKNFFHALGKKDWKFIDDEGRKWSPENLVALILKKLKIDAESSGTELVTGVVATFPAYFNDLQKDSFRLAFERSGLKLDFLLEDYTAVLEGYGFSKEDDKEKNFLVFDLGQSHFHTSVVRCGNNEIKPLYLSKRYEIGGQDFDKKVLEMIVDQLKRVEGLNMEEGFTDVSHLEKSSELIKAKLSSKFSSLTTEIISIENELVEIILTKNAYEKNIEPLIVQLLDVVKLSLKESELKTNQIDHVLLVGGATKMNFIQENLKQIFGTENNKIICETPRKIMARGAALYAYTNDKSDFVKGLSSDGNGLGYDLNILFEDDLTGQKTNHTFFTKYAQLPDTKMHSFELAYPKQKNIEFKVIKNDSLGDLSVVLGIIDVDIPRDISMVTIEITANIDHVGDCSFMLKAKETGRFLEFNYRSGVSPVPQKIKVERRKIRVVPKKNKAKVVVKAKKISNEISKQNPSRTAKQTSNGIKIKIKPKNNNIITTPASTKVNPKKVREAKIDWKNIINEMIINNLR